MIKISFLLDAGRSKNVGVSGKNRTSGSEEPSFNRKIVFSPKTFRAFAQVIYDCR